MYRFGVIGAGKMGQSILRGALKNNLYLKNEVIIYDVNLNIISSLKEEGFKIAKSELEVYENVDVVLFSVKPQNYENLLNKLKESKKEPLLLSIAAGIKISYINEYINNEKVIRVMPNTPSLVGFGATAIAYNYEISDNDKKLVLDIFNSIGITEIIKEDQMDNVIPVNGSLPAFLYYYIRGFIDGVVKKGISYEVAKKLACQSMIGSAKMILESNKPITELINDVCSPNGVTIEGINVLDNYELNNIIDEVIEKTIARSIELGNK